MDDTETIRVTFPSDALDRMRELNPLALNDPELARFYAGLGYIAAQQQANAGVDVENGTPVSVDDTETDTNDAD